MSTRPKAKAAPARRAKRTLVFPSEHRVISTVVAILVSLGVVMIYSASSAKNALQSGGSGSQQLVRTLFLGLLPGLILCFYLQRVSLSKIRSWGAPLMLGSLGLVTVVLIPGVGQQINGARRWINAGLTNFQPSELVKVGLIICVADLALRHRDAMGSITEALKMILWPVLLGGVLIAVEPDLGTAMVCVVTGLIIVWMAGMPWRVLGPITGVIVGSGVIYAVMEPYRFARLAAFLDPWASGARNSTGFQSVQGQIALGSGGIFGVGPGQSVQKIFYLPEAHTDFILAVIGEELGLLAVLAILGLFGALMRAGLNLARKAVDPYAKLTAAGLTALITCQAMLNICVVLGIAPLTGVPLPFISFGPTNLVVLLGSTGLLLNIAATGGAELRSVSDSRGKSSGEANESHDRGRGYGRARDSSAQRR